MTGTPDNEAYRELPAWKLIGASGSFRVPGGHTVYEAVCYNLSTARSDRPRLARLETSGGQLRQINRYVDWEEPIEVVALDD